MLCKVSGEYVAFELAEVCSPEIPREMSHVPPTEGVSKFIRSGNPVSEIARKKREKSKDYRTDYPIERHCQVADERAFVSLGAERPSLGQQAQ